jgi:SAM-dependent methyltransferase
MNIFKTLCSKKAFLMLWVLGTSAWAAKKTSTDFEIPFQDSSGVQSVIRIPKTLPKLFSKKTLKDVSPDYMDPPTLTQIVQNLFPGKKKLDVLEIGPGPCKSALNLLKNDPRPISWDGVDIYLYDQKNLDALKKETKGTVRFFRQGIETFVPDKQYDLIFLECSGFDVPHCLFGIKMLAPSLKKGGAFCFLNGFDNPIVNNFSSQTQDYQLDEKKSFSLSGKVPTYFDSLKEVVKRETGVTLETFQFIHNEPEIANQFPASFPEVLQRATEILWVNFLKNGDRYLRDIKKWYVVPLKYRSLAQEYDLLKKEGRYEDEDWQEKIRSLSESLEEFKVQADDFKCIGRRVKERRDEARWNKGDIQERRKILSKYDDHVHGVSVHDTVVVLRKD